MAKWGVTRRVRPTRRRTPGPETARYIHWIEFKRRDARRESKHEAGEAVAVADNDEAQGWLALELVRFDALARGHKELGEDDT